jgi:hypothetical protein
MVASLTIRSGHGIPAGGMKLDILEWISDRGRRPTSPASCWMIPVCPMGGDWIDEGRWDA